MEANSISESTSTSTATTTTSAEGILEGKVPISNFSLIEGPWKDFSLKRVEPQDYPRVVRHVQDYFMKDEPTCALLGYTTDFLDEMEALVRTMLGDNLSFLAEHEETGEVAGVRIIFRSSPSYSSLQSCSVSSYAGRAFLRLVNIMKKMANLYEVYGVEEIAQVFIASCGADYRGQGLDTEMYKRGLDFLKASGFKVVEAMTTSPFTKEAATSMGFQEVCRLDYKEFIDEMGQPMFTLEELSEDNFAAVMVKVL